MEALLDGEGEELTRLAIERAKAGDMVALRLCLDRLLPPRKERPIAFDMPAIETAADLSAATAAILRAVAAGDLTTTEAVELSRVLADHARALEVGDLDRRLRALEEHRQ